MKVRSTLSVLLVLAALGGCSSMKNETATGENWKMPESALEGQRLQKMLSSAEQMPAHAGQDAILQ
jgi:hypothetical protein